MKITRLTRQNTSDIFTEDKILLRTKKQKGRMVNAQNKIKVAHDQERTERKKFYLGFARFSMIVYALFAAPFLLVCLLIAYFSKNAFYGAILAGWYIGTGIGIPLLATTSYWLYVLRRWFRERTNV